MGKFQIMMAVESDSVFGIASAVAAMNSSEVLAAMVNATPYSGSLTEVVTALDVDAVTSMRKARELLS